MTEVEQQNGSPTPDVAAWMAAHRDARHGKAVAKRRLEEREKRPTSTLKKLSPVQLAKAWREGGHGPLPDLN